MRATAIVLVIVLFSVVTPGRGTTKTVTLKFQTSWAEYTLTFDPDVISVDEVRKLAPISPYDFYACSKPDLEYCVTGSCHFDLRTAWRSPNYYKNAELNVQNARKQLDFLQNLTYPAELRPSVQHLLRFWSFNTWLEETRLEFYKTWDIEVLKRKYQNLDPAKTCSGPIRSIQAEAADRDTQYMLAEFQWATCLAEKYQPEIGVYPTQAWKIFQANYHIKEKVKVQEDDND